MYIYYIYIYVHVYTYRIYLHACVTVFDSMTMVHLTGFTEVSKAPYLLHPFISFGRWKARWTTGAKERRPTQIIWTKSVNNQVTFMQMKLITLLFRFFEHILQGMAQKRYASGISTKYLYSDQLQVSYLWHPLAMKMVGSPRHIPLCFSVWHSSTSMTQSFVPLAKSLHLANYYHWYATLGSNPDDYMNIYGGLVWVFSQWVGELWISIQNSKITWNSLRTLRKKKVKVKHMFQYPILSFP